MLMILEFVIDGSVCYRGFDIIFVVFMNGKCFFKIIYFLNYKEVDF